MKAFVVPSACGAVGAAMSLIFYALFNRAFGSELLGTIILLQSVAAILQMTIVPQSWLYVLGAPDRAELDRRYALSMWIELITGAIGIGITIALTLLPIRGLMDHRWETVLIFMGLWGMGSTSHQGYLRARFAWWRYGGFVLWPAVLRLALAVIALAVPNLVRGLTPVAIVGIVFCLPDLSRLALATTMGMVRHPYRFTIIEIVVALRRIAHNWLFDFGSGIIENADKLLVGWALSPAMLIIYFFARRIGGAATIAIEPLYAELYRRMQQRPAAERPQQEVLAFAIGSGVALVAIGAIIMAFLAAGIFPVLAHYVPDPVAAHSTIFIALLLIDAGICANRWARFLFQQGFGSTLLLIVRLTLRAIFGVALLAMSHADIAAGIVYAYLIMFLCELAFMIAALRGVGRGAGYDALQVGNVS